MSEATETDLPKQTSLTIPIAVEINELLKKRAARLGRSVTGHVKFLILQDLRSGHLVDEDFEPRVNP